MYQQTAQETASNPHQQVNTDQPPSHVIFETVEYKDFIQQEQANDETTQPNQSSPIISDTPDIANSLNTLEQNIRDSQLNVTSESKVKEQFYETNCGEIIQIDEEYYEECDCASLCECVYGIENANEDGDDSVQWIEDDQELFRPAKKPKMDHTQANNAQAKVADQSQRQPTDAAQANQMNNHNKRFITVHLQCPQSDCSDRFAEGQLNQHMWEKHFIRSNRCLVKDCHQSFDFNNILTKHIKEVHSDIAEWHCEKCVKHFINYQQLSLHVINRHQVGQFQCSVSSCTFTGEHRRKIYDHYYRQHKQTLSCQHLGCNFRTTIPSHLKRHERTHSGIKPYRCKWPDCHYANTRKDHAIRHVRRHFAHNPSLVPNGTLLDPKDYVVVVHELL